jgi:enoyl-CoA hydratase/carnithine racemase
LDDVKLETSGKIATITVDRPEKRNALNSEVRSEIFAVIKAGDANDAIQATIITGEGESFVAGADIAPMKYY